uniref:RING-type domain-containing protein n=1 Tax=viral metagenome TaxID=1070528 RepID=A0A6C0HTX6_9ZZZZ
MSPITEDCPICLDELISLNSIFVTDCNHKFHRECICNIKICPCCRKEIKEKMKERKGNITITIDRISLECYDKICEYYNERQTLGKIQRLDRHEGGFCVEIKKEERESEFENDRIRQLRWNKKKLVSGMYKGLLYEEECLLYVSMCVILGDEYVSEGNQGYL